MNCNEKQQKCHPDNAVYYIHNCHCCNENRGTSNPGNTQAGSGNPIGTIIAYPAATIPSNYLECNGAEIEREAYVELFEIIGKTYGSGDGETTFNLPDLRGEFIRGWANDSDVDAGRALGSNQSDMVGPHMHNTYMGSGGNLNIPVSQQAENASAGTEGNESLSTNRILPNDGYENRPRNVAMIYCIKAK